MIDNDEHLLYVGGGEQRCWAQRRRLLYGQKPSPRGVLTSAQARARNAGPAEFGLYQRLPPSLNRIRSGPLT